MMRMRCASLPDTNQYLIPFHYQVIKLDPSSPWGYEMKHAALHKAGSYDDAIATFKTMLSKLSQSRDPEICSECISVGLKG